MIRRCLLVPPALPLLPGVKHLLGHRACWELWGSFSRTCRLHFVPLSGVVFILRLISPALGSAFFTSCGVLSLVNRGGRKVPQGCWGSGWAAILRCAQQQPPSCAFQPAPTSHPSRTYLKKTLKRHSSCLVVTLHQSTLLEEAKIGLNTADTL